LSCPDEPSRRGRRVHRNRSVAVNEQVAVYIGPIQRRTRSGTAGRYSQVIVLDFCLNDTQSGCNDEVIRDSERCIEIKTNTCSLVGVNQLHHVIGATNSRELHVIDAIAEDRTVDQRPSAVRAYLEAGFNRRDGFGIRR
jgi:hypothetical protein